MCFSTRTTLLTILVRPATSLFRGSSFNPPTHFSENSRENIYILKRVLISQLKVRESVEAFGAALISISFRSTCLSALGCSFRLALKNHPELAAAAAAAAGVTDASILLGNSILCAAAR